MTSKTLAGEREHQIRPETTMIKMEMDFSTWVPCMKMQKTNSKTSLVKWELAKAKVEDGTMRMTIRVVRIRLAGLTRATLRIATTMTTVHLTTANGDTVTIMEAITAFTITAKIVLHGEDHPPGLKNGVMKIPTNRARGITTTTINKDRKAHGETTNRTTPRAGMKTAMNQPNEDREVVNPHAAGTTIKTKHGVMRIAMTTLGRTKVGISMEDNSRRKKGTDAIVAMDAVAGKEAEANARPHHATIRETHTAGIEMHPRILSFRVTTKRMIPSGDSSRYPYTG